MFGKKKKNKEEVTRYTANIELPNGERWAETPTGLTKSGRWTDASLHKTKKSAQAAAERIAKTPGAGEGAKPFVQRLENLPKTSEAVKKNTIQNSLKPVTREDLDKALDNFIAVKEIIKSGDARNLAFKKPMKFYREHSVEEAVALLKKEATSSKQRTTTTTTSKR